MAFFRMQALAELDLDHTGGLQLRKLRCALAQQLLQHLRRMLAQHGGRAVLHGRGRQPQRAAHHRHIDAAGMRHGKR